MPQPSPLCLVAQKCGGCPLIEEDLTSQREQKKKRVSALLQDALGQAFNVKSLSFHPAVSVTAYRNRLRLQIDSEGRFGFFNPNKSPECAVLLPALKERLEEIKERLEPVRAQLAFYAHLEIRSPDLHGQAGLYFTSREVTAPGREDYQRAIAQAAGSDTDCGFLEAGAPPVPQHSYPLTSEVYQRVPLGGFMQVNFEVNTQLVTQVVSEAKARGKSSVLDLYCGSGNFLLPLLHAGLKGVGVELNSDSILAARQAAHEQELGGEWVCADVPKWLEQQGQLSGLWDLLILDPPRAGLRQAVELVDQVDAPTVIMCSCNDKSLARDLKELTARGYSLESVTLFDMFAHTSHVESLAILSRLPRARAVAPATLP